MLHKTVILAHTRRSPASRLLLVVRRRPLELVVIFLMRGGLLVGQA